MAEVVDIKLGFAY